jgi:6-phosphogluconolactonase
MPPSTGSIRTPWPTRIRVEADAVAACRTAAGLIRDRLRRAVSARGRASVAFSGGSTPGPMFDALVVTDVDWEAVDVFQVDERVAPDGDPDRNASLLRDRLVGPLGLSTRRLHLMPVTAADLAAACARYADALTAVAPLDVVHLGLGADGHTASWPPGDPVVDSPRPVDLSAEYQGRRRMTLTPGPVNAARSRIVLVTEATKAPIVARWLRGDPALPVARVRRSATIPVLTLGAAGGR